MTASSTAGLTSAEVAQRVARGQINRVRRSPAAEYAGIVARNVFTLFNFLVVPAALALFHLGDLQAAVAVSGMATTNLVLGLVQEVRAHRHLNRLTLLAEARVRVQRDGQAAAIPAGEVVQDDLLLVAAGEAIVADGTVLTASFFEVDESLLTGESIALSRRPGEQLLSGSFCVAGEGTYRADKVGAAAFAHRLAAEARSYQYQPSPLQVSINRLLFVLTVAALLLCGLYLGLYLAGRLDIPPLVAMAAATITSMIPQGLVLMATLAFVLGAVHLSGRGVLVQQLSAVESMASIDTLCLDKTGTLTTNQLRLERLHVLAAGLDEEQVRDRARLFASLSVDRGSKSLAALRAALGDCPGELLDQLPFKSQNLYSAIRARTADGEQVLVLGAFEALQPYLLAPAAADAERVWHSQLSSGLRLLLLAEASAAADGVFPPFAGSLAGLGLRPLALVALSDELRSDARTVLEELAGGGMEIRILSGDNPETVRATVASLASGSSVPALHRLVETRPISGAELEAAADPEEVIRRHLIFGRVSPAAKVQIVQTLQKQGRRVAMMGDGVNDVLAIKHASLGIALGEGSSASKTVAGLVLQSSRFDVLPETLEEGRTILHNLRRAGKLFLVKNAYTLVLILGALGVFGLSFPYRPQQVTLLNFLTIGGPSLLITFSRSRARGRSARDFLADVGGFALSTGLVLGAAALAMQLQAARLWQATEEMQRTVILSLLILLGVTTLQRVLDDGDSRSQESDRRLRLLAVAIGPLYLLVLYCAPLADFFELVPLDGRAWLAVAIMTLAGALVLRGWDAWRRRSSLRR
jgi:cation-transporting ATPase E